MAKSKNKHKGKSQGKPRGATYADVLARKRAVQAGLEKFASDTALQIEADTRTQRAMWLMVCSIADAFGVGPERMKRDFFPALQANTDELNRMREEVDEDYAYDKLKQRAEQVTGIDIQYMYEHEMRAAGLKLGEDGEYTPITRLDRIKEQSQWISIKERPPIDETKDYQEKWEEDPEFLVMIKDGVVPTCLYFDGVNWYANGGEPFTYNVTHWMPLPEPPKGGAEE